MIEVSNTLPEEEIQEDKKKVSKSKQPPMGYIAVNLESFGQLDAPPVLHFRDFSYAEALDLADSSLEENNNLKKMIHCLNEMVWEPFDCNYLNLNELYQILYTLQANFYDPYLEKEIYINEDLPEDDINDPTNIIRATIPISSFKTISLLEGFKEPFVVKDDKTGIEITARLSRIKDFTNADDYWKKENARIMREFSDVENAMLKISMEKNKDKKIAMYTNYATDNYDRVFEYQNLMAKRIKQVATIVQGSCLIKFGSEKINDINDVSKVMPRIPKRLWDKYIKKSNENIFGINPEVTFKCSELESKTITRRLSFRTVDFFQNSE